MSYSLRCRRVAHTQDEHRWMPWWRPPTELGMDEAPDTTDTEGSLRLRVLLAVRHLLLGPLVLPAQAEPA